MAIEAERGLVSAEIPQLGEGDIGYPNIGLQIVRADAPNASSSWLSVSSGMTVEQFCETNQRSARKPNSGSAPAPLTFGNALGSAFGLDEHPAHQIVRQRVV